MADQNRTDHGIVPAQLDAIVMQQGTVHLLMRSSVYYLIFNQKTLCSYRMVDLYDVDKLILRDMLTANIDFVLGGVVHLANTRQPNTPNANRGCCVVSSPGYLYVADNQKVGLAREIKNLTGHVYLPVSAMADRFMGTGAGRRVTFNVLKDALLNAGIPRIDYEIYGQKSPMRDYAWLAFMDRGCEITLDIGSYFEMDNVAAGRIGVMGVLGQPNELFGPGRFTVHPMFDDLMFRLFGDRVGTVEWTGCVRSGNMRVTGFKCYPTYVHWLKAMFPPHLFDFPSHFRGLSKKLRCLSSVVFALSTIDVNSEDCKNLLKVRAEVTVVIDGPCNSNALKHFVHEIVTRMSDVIFVRQVPVVDISANLRDWLDRMARDNVARRREGALLPLGIRNRVASLMNEAGIVTTTVQRYMVKRMASGRFSWELPGRPPCAPLPYNVIQQAPVADDSSDESEESEASDDADDLLNEIRLRVDVSRCGRNRAQCVRNVYGHVVRRVIRGETVEDLYQWVLATFGARYQYEVICR